MSCRLPLHSAIPPFRHSLISLIPVNPRRRPTQRPPAFLIRRQYYRFLVAEDQMGAQDGTDPACQRSLLELDCAVDAIGIGAGEGRESPLFRSIQQRLGTRDAALEGEI